MEQLRRLAQALHLHDIKLIVGGGYGLLLRTAQVRQSDVRTRIAELSGTRSTADIDIFLSAEIIISAEKMIRIRETLKELGYQPIETAKFYQFVLPISYLGFERGIKVDFLAAPVAEDKQQFVDQDARRIKPRGMTGLHAHTTPEALTVEDHTLNIDIKDSNNRPLEVCIPHPFSYLLLKLFALNDQLNNDRKGYGAHHAFDIYRTIGLMTEQEWGESLMLRDQYRRIEPIPQACALASQMFSNSSAIGILRLLEHAKSVNEEITKENLQILQDDLQELLPL
jgi:hypothetical protein